MLASRLVVMLLFAVLLSAAPFHAKLAQTPPDLGTASSYAVLARQAVTLTDSTIYGDVGVCLGGAITLTRSRIEGARDYAADIAYDDFPTPYGDFLIAYNSLADVLCEGKPLTGTLDGVTLAPGVYCFDAAATLTGVLTLLGSSSDTWIFKIGNGGTGALTGTNFSVVGKTSTGETWQACNNNVYWWVADYATLTDSVFIGSILAGAAITVTGGTFDGNALAKAAVTLTGTTVGCTPWSPPVTPIPIQLGSIKVTGGGQISVPNGQATFGFNAQPDKKGGGAKGNLNYVNHVTGLHINGTVDNIMVIDINLDISPKTVLFSGTYEGGSFFVTVEDNGEPGRTDEFGITVTTATDELSEVRSQRVISRGNIQFHK